MQDDNNRAIRFRSQGMSEYELSIIPLRYGAILKQVPDLYTDKTILDMGCGFGAGCKFLLENKASYVIGVDANKTDIESALTHYNDEKIRYNISYNWYIPCPNNVFDVITNVECIEHNDFEERDLMLKEAHRVLRENGYLMITTPNKRKHLTFPSGSHFMEYEFDELKEIVCPFGFEFVTGNPSIGESSMCLLFKKV